MDVCPFCGGPAELYITNHIPKGYDFTPRCLKTICCGRLTKKYTSRKTAVQCWNLRVPMNQLNYDFKQKVRDVTNELHKMKQMSNAHGIEMIDTDSIFFSSYESALKYATNDPSISFSKFSAPGQILLIRQENGSIGKYIIGENRELISVLNEPNNDTGPNIYTKSEVDKII